MNVTSIIDGEYAENEIRKDFTVSERIAIGKAIEARLGERRGRPEKSAKPESSENSANLRTFSPGTRTAKLAAEAAGFKERTYEAAKKVIEQAAPVDPVEHMRAIVRHFDALAPEAGRFMVQIGGTRETVGYAAYAYVSLWVTDPRLRGGGYWRDDATELSRRFCS